MPRGTLEVILISAEDLHDSDFFGKMDPYVILTYRTQEKRSKVAKGAGSKPRWNESFLFTVSDSVSELDLRLMDKDTFTNDDFLGQTKINLEPVFAVGSIPETSYNVVKDQNYCGKLKVALTFNPQNKGLSKVDEGVTKLLAYEVNKFFDLATINHLFQ